MEISIVLILCLVLGQGESLPDRRDGRIIGGSEIPISIAPYQAAVFKGSLQLDVFNFTCGGKECRICDISAKSASPIQKSPHLSIPIKSFCMERL